MPYILLNNTIIFIMIGIIYVIHILMNKCKPIIETENINNRFCFIFGNDSHPSIQTLVKTMCKSIIFCILVYLYLKITPLSTLSWDVQKYVLLLMIAHDYMAAMFDYIVELDIMYFPYECYYMFIYLSIYFLSK